MGNMITAKVTIKGTRALLWHAFGPDAIPLEKQEKTGVAGNDPEEWRKTVLVSKDGQLYLRPTQVFGAVRDGARYTKKGRASLMKPIAATLQVVDHRILVDRWMPGFPNNGQKYDPKIANPPERDEELPVYLDVQGVVQPKTRGRNVRYRVGASPGWTADFRLMWDKTIISRSEMEAVLIDTGQLVGIGNGRSIGLGRFEVIGFTVSE